MTKKRSSPDDNADPTEFINQYFERRGIKVTEDSGANKDCVRRAEEAREAYKRMRSCAAQDVSSVRGDAPAGLDADVLTPAQKYNRRLVNNRKSAAAARVYQEVLKREQSNMLRSVEEERDKCLHDRDRALEERDRMAQEKDHIVQTAKQVSRERDHMASEIERLNRDLAFLRQQVSISRRSVDGMNTTVRKVYSQSQSQSQSQSIPMSAPMPASQEMMERKDEISPSKAQMPSAVRSVLPGPFTFSSSGSQGEEMKLFPGLNSQSQPEESEDKGGIFMRPTGAALQAGVLHSQLSQDVSAMRCSLGSAEDVGHPDPNFFLTQSFPTDKSVAAT